MLKIKNDVDLKELEKFGYKKNKEYYIKEFPSESIFFKKEYIRIRHLKDYAYYKEIWNCGEDVNGFVCSSYNCENRVNDLIKADLVECVEDE